MERTTSFGYWLRRRRKALDLTQEELARQVGCAVGTIKKLEGDDRRPSRQMAERLADLLQIAPEERAAFLKAARAELATDQLEVAAVPLETPAPAPLASLPTGTVTFLFTDIEDSTQLWSQHPEGMPVALARHDALLRAAIERHGGAVFKTVGDAFHAAFGTATDALATALTAQRALQTERWEQVMGPQAVQSNIRVRMALHSGTARVRTGDYFGHTLNRVARILAAGHGGQILLSAATWELLRDQLPPDVALRDLGAYWLKGLPRAEQIYQLAAADLPSDFPPLVSLNQPTTNLPAQTTAFIGREREVGAVRDLLRRADVRLITLTGPGGTGKTRLALEAAAVLAEDPSPLPPQAGVGLFRDGVWFVNLAPISDSALAASAIAQALGVHEAGGQSLLDSLKRYLHEKRLLLLLDNFEQVVDAAPAVAELLAAALGLKVLITSRMPLRLSGEREFAVPPLALPDPKHLPPELDRLTQYEAVRLFVERVQAVKADFAITSENAPAVAEICYRLDGLPLAIELAAARIKLFPPQALLARLGSRLKFLTGGARDLPARQQTIRNAIGWSYEMLDEGEKRLFTRLGVFVGGCTLEATEAVCNIDDGLPMEVVDGVAALLDKSLVRQEEGSDGEPRFTLLETIHEYARERLGQRRELEELRRRHADYFLALAEAAEPHLQGPNQAAWLNRLETDHDNLRSALAWSQAADGNTNLGLRLVAALWPFWWAHGYHSEGRQWLAAALSTDSNTSTTARASALMGAANLAFIQDEHAQAHMLGTGALVLARNLGDRRVIASALNLLGRVALGQSNNEQAFMLAEESLTVSRELGDRHGVAGGLHVMGWAAWLQGNYALAATLMEESLVINRALDDKGGVGWLLNFLGAVAVDQGGYGQATARLEESRLLFRQLGEKHGLATSTMNLGHVALAQGDYELAGALAAEGLSIYQDVGNTWGIAWVRYLQGSTALKQDDDARASVFLRDSLALLWELEYKNDVPRCLEGLGGVAVVQGQLERAATLFGAAEALRESINVLMPPSERADYGRAVAAARAQLGEDAFAATWEAGRALPLEQAIEEALGEGG